MIKITTDVFNIFKRIKLININYCIFYDFSKFKFFVVDEVSNNIIYSLPFSSLDERTLKYVSDMDKKSNLDILKEIETHNEKLTKINNEKIIESAMNSAEKILKELT